MRTPGAALLLAWILLLGPSTLLPISDAGFTDSSSSTGNSWSADTLDAPTALTAIGGAAVTLDWTATSDTYASGHRVFRATSPGGPYTQIAQLTPRSNVSHVDNAALGTYYYAVRAFHGTWESGNSNEVSASVVEVALTGSWQAGLTHVPASGSDRMMVFAASNEQASTSGPTLTSVSYGGQALTKVRADSVVSSGKTGSLEVWILDEAGIAAAGGNTISVVWAATPNAPLYSHAILEHVDQVSPVATTTSAFSSADTPNPVPMSSVATGDNDLVVVAATAGETGTYTPQNGFTFGNNQDTPVETTALGTAYLLADGSSVTASMLFNPSSPPWINRQVVTAIVVAVAS